MFCLPEPCLTFLLALDYPSDLTTGIDSLETSGLPDKDKSGYNYLDSFFFVMVIIFTVILNNFN